MVRRRVLALAVAVAFAAAGMPAVLAQPQPPPRKEERKRSKQEQVEIEQIVKMVDAVMAGQPGPSDIQVTLTPYFLKSQEQRTFVPFVLDVKNAPVADVAMYVRVVNPAATPDPKTKKIEFPWDDIHFLPASALVPPTAPATSPVAAAAPATPAGVKINRVFMAVPGTYDVYVALRERLPEKAPKDKVAKSTVMKTSVTVPDFWGGELATSSILVTDKVNMLTAPLNPEEARERPFVFGAQELVPASDMEFKKSEELSIFFQLYNAGLDAAGKPNLVMEYNFHRKEGETEKFFNKTTPQEVNAQVLPPTFDPSKFPVPGGITVPLASFPEGQYRLEIKINDKASGKTLTKDVNFAVKG
jgi:hypothetical protein